MDKSIRTFYAEYGRYISRFRMIPLDIDALAPVDRRILLTMHTIAKKRTKSATIVGHCIGNLHPHGDLSCYGSLVELVRGGFADSTKSSWGGPGLNNDAPAAASRYTETSILPWVEKTAFEFIDYVPWENLELSPEPIYLPCIVPIGLIGDGLITGIAYHKTVIPKYKKNDLIKRLLWLLKHGKPNPPASFEDKMDPEIYGPIIVPNKSDCGVFEAEPNAFYKLLILGEGKITYEPNAETNGKQIIIKGRAPMATFKSVLDDYAKGILPFVDKPIDACKENDVEIIATIKRGTDPETFLDKFREDYLDKNISFKCYFTNEQGIVNQYGIDDILLNAFSHWREASLKKFGNDIDIINNKIVSNHICKRIKTIIQKNKQIMSVDDLIKDFDKSDPIVVDRYENKQWIKTSIDITDELIKETCRSSSIQKLIEYKSIDEELQKQHDNVSDNINNHVKYIGSKIKELYNI